jgi:cytochrome c
MHSRKTFGLLLAICIALPLAAIADPVADGDPERGNAIYDRCFACHAIDRDRTGPRHAGLFGRVAGSLPGFPYSPAMRKAGAGGLIWTAQTLDRFLESPTTFIPGTRMGYVGIKDNRERADLIAYLKEVTR